ncbi:hypothetical protein FRC20_000114 [Serendipita sp. 405]|nr:hypothetical protein FRC20_000114 [Serendipita sp. 405]
MTSIVEGYDQVPDFDNLEDSEYEEEEVCYVTLDLGPLDPSLLPKATSYQLIVCALVTFVPILFYTQVFKGFRDKSTFFASGGLRIQGTVREPVGYRDSLPRIGR